VITGTAQAGRTLAATPGRWANRPTSFTYQWLRCDLTSCNVEVGADTNQYALSGADQGHKIKVEVTAANALDGRRKFRWQPLRSRPDP
jgi:hypothetical protein